MSKKWPNRPKPNIRSIPALRPGPLISIACLIAKQPFRCDENKETTDGNQGQDDTEDEDLVIVLD